MELEDIVLYPFEFFELDINVQYDLMLNQLDFVSMNNLCEAARLSKKVEAVQFFRVLCADEGFWKEKGKHDFGWMVHGELRFPPESTWREQYEISYVEWMKNELEAGREGEEELEKLKVSTLKKLAKAMHPDFIDTGVITKDQLVECILIGGCEWCGFNVVYTTLMLTRDPDKLAKEWHICVHCKKQWYMEEI